MRAKVCGCLREHFPSRQWQSPAKQAVAVALTGCRRRVDTNADTPKALPAHDISLASNEPFLPTGRRLASVPSQRLLTRARSARQRSFSNETRTACVTWRALLKVFCWTPLSRLPPRCFAPIAQRGNAHRSITPPARHHRNPKRRNSGALVPYTCRPMRGKNGTVDAHGASSQAIKQPNNQAPSNLAAVSRGHYL